MRDKTNPIDNYVLSLIGGQPEVFTDIEEQLKSDGKYGINIGATEGVILAFLVKAFNVRSILEIGTQYGYSTSWLLKNLPSDGTLISIEKNEAHYEQAKKNILDSRCSLFCGDAQKILSQELAKSQFDLIFIDANKKAYPEYLKYAKDHINTRGLIVGDNTFLMNSVFSETSDKKIDSSLTEAMRLFNKEIFSDSRFTSCILPTNEGMSLAFRSH